MSGGGKTTGGTQQPMPGGASGGFPAAMPGQLQDIASQLGQGFGQQPSDILSYLNQIYRPSSAPGYAKDSTPAKPKAGTSSVSHLSAMLGYTPESMQKNGQTYVKNPMSGGWVPESMVAEFHRNGGM